MGNRPVLTRTRQPAGAAGAHLCAPPAPTQQHTGVWDTCRNTSPANLCHELASSWAMPTRCRPLRAVAKREWTCATLK